MDLTQLHAADRVRHALAGHAILTKTERDDAVLAAIARVESANARANTAREKGYAITADMLDRLIDGMMADIDRLLALPTVSVAISEWSLAS